MEASSVSVYLVHLSGLFSKCCSALHPVSRLSSAYEVSLKKGKPRLQAVLLLEQVGASEMSWASHGAGRPP